MLKKRADLLLMERGLCESRSKAQALVMAGQVFSGDSRVEKPGTQLAEDAPLEVRGVDRFVSRGGHKLEGALEAFGEHLGVAGAVCVDVGASTGGFTDCLLQRGVAKVYAVDVGQGQLAAKLVQDSRVEIRDKTNARFLAAKDFAEAIDLVVVDASFIGIGKLAGAIAATLRVGGHLVAMIKPQFEVGRDVARRFKGVIRDPKLRQAAIEGVKAELEAVGFELLAEADSKLPGPKGNLECFVLARLTSPPREEPDDTQNTSTQMS